jgi:hypothetical protein
LLDYGRRISATPGMSSEPHSSGVVLNQSLIGMIRKPQPPIHRCNSAA